MIKNEGLPDHTPESEPLSFTRWPHVHPFRTVDSNGNKHAACAPIGGHHHIIEMKPDPKGGAPIIVGMSGPMKKKWVKRGGRRILIDAPVNDFDFHTHDMLYVRSEKILARAHNAEAARVAASIANKEAGGLTKSEQSAIAGAGARNQGM